MINFVRLRDVAKQRAAPRRGMVANSRPDGETILITVSGIANSVSLYKKLTYDLVKDFAPVMQLADTQLPLAGSYAGSISQALLTRSIDA